MNKKVLLSVFAASLFAVPTSSALAEFTNVPNVQYEQEDVNGNGILDGGDLYYNEKGLANKDEYPYKDPKKFPRYVQTDYETGKPVEQEETKKPSPVKTPGKKVVKVLPKTSAVK